MKTKLRKRCDSCKKLRHDVTKQVDPYTHDIDGLVVERWMCTDCYHASAQDI
jgi:hypothetical protein